MKIIVAGLGIKNAEELTLRSIHALEECKLILAQTPAISELSETLQQYKLAPVESLNSSYLNGRSDEENYASEWTKIMERLNEFKTIGLIFPGHPRVGISIVQILERRKAEIGYDLIVCEGISSFDTMINDLAIDPLEKGSLLIDANRLILFDTIIPNEVNTFIYHPASIGNVYTDFKNPCERNKPSILKRKLLKQFHPEKRLALVTSSSSSNETAKIKWFLLNDLEEAFESIDFWSSLFVPAEHPKKINNTFLKCISEHEK